MTVADAPIVLILVGLVAYVVLAGADFGAGFWQLTRDASVREQAYRAMGPVWEANHVWLIFVLVVFWTCYPVAFASILSTLAAPLFVVAVGIILRGTAYAMRSEIAQARGRRRVELLLATSSILTPFALGAAVGGIASDRVPVGNARGDLVTSWLNPTSLLIGTLAVACGAYLAAVYLAADATRLGSRPLVRAFRARALASGIVAGALALSGLVVLRWDAHAIWNGLTEVPNVGAIAGSGVAGIATLVLTVRGRYGTARLTAAVAVALVVVGWAAAQSPRLVGGLTIGEAAAPRATLIATLVGTALGSLVVVPALALLFVLVLRGRFDPGREAQIVADTLATRGEIRRPPASLALALFLGGAALVVFAEEPWAQAAGVLALLASIAAGFVLVAAPERAPAPR